MNPRITFITLGVDDLERAVRFYRDGLGWPTEGIVGREFEHGAVAFFSLAHGLRLALWPRASIAHDTGLPIAARGAGAAFTLAHNVGLREAVDDVVRAATAAGATLIKRPHATFWGGYAGYIADLDGHVWEIAWNPKLPID